ncbi:MAG: S49 family peptidase [Chlamydiota bacterium]
MRHSFFHGIFYGSVRSFFVALTATIGVVFGFIFLLLIIGGISSSTNKEVDQDYDLEILANADGVRKVESKKSPVILQLNIHGVIGAESLNMHTIRQQLIESREGDLEKDRVKALLLHINTPGGTVNDADAIYRAVLAYKEKFQIPVYAYVDGLCASGGMYVASAADKVYASEVSLIGSVGVLSPSFFNFTGLIDKIGVKSQTISEGKGKDDMNPFRPWKPDEDKMYKEIIKYYYDMFVSIVINARPQIGKEKLVEKYGAGIFPAQLAQEYGFIDQANASRSETLKRLLHEINIEDDYYQVVGMSSSNWASKIFSKNNPLLKGTMHHKIELPQEVDANLSGKYLYLYQPANK